MLCFWVLQAETTRSHTPSCRQWQKSESKVGQAVADKWALWVFQGCQPPSPPHRHGPVGLVHVDAHTDTGDRVLGERICHGTPFRRCVEEGLLDCQRVVQIGIRGSSYSPDPYKFCWDQVSPATLSGSPK